MEVKLDKQEDGYEDFYIPSNVSCTVYLFL